MSAAISALSASMPIRFSDEVISGSGSAAGCSLSCFTVRS